MLVIRGMYGVGDCIHQRAIVRDAMKLDRVVLETFYWSMYEDLVEHGLQLRLIHGHEPRVRELIRKFPRLRPPPPINAMRFKITYNRDMIMKHGNLLAAQYSCLGMRMPVRPDFSLPVPDAWRDAARRRIALSSRKSVMIFRPSVLNNVWRSESRAPDPASYASLYESIRDRYHVISVANLGSGGEHFHGPELGADQCFHHGELSFEELAGLFSEARVALTCPGFAPVLSQAVGTPTVIVYGGNESYETTNIVGAHLAPTLAIQPSRPCACHLKTHDCDKTLDMPMSHVRLSNFLAHRCAS